eukprot:1717181-Prymnesium_polylepis.1
MNRRTERMLQERQEQLFQAREQAQGCQTQRPAPHQDAGASSTAKQRAKVTCTMLNEAEKQLLRVKNRAVWMQSAGASLPPHSSEPQGCPPLTGLSRAARPKNGARRPHVADARGAARQGLASPGPGPATPATVQRDAVHGGAAGPAGH